MFFAVVITAAYSFSFEVLLSSPLGARIDAQRVDVRHRGAPICCVVVRGAFVLNLKGLLSSVKTRWFYSVRD